MFSFKRRVGNIAEDFACSYLKKNGYKILGRNYSKKIGEIDIVAKRKGRLFFIEVKSGKENRENNFYPEENVTYHKSKKLINTCQLWLSENKIDENTPWQIDVVSIILDENNQQKELFYIPNAINQDF